MWNLQFVNKTDLSVSVRNRIGRNKSALRYLKTIKRSKKAKKELLTENPALLKLIIEATLPTLETITNA